MKGITFLMLLVFGISQAQFFQSEYEEPVESGGFFSSQYESSNQGNFPIQEDDVDPGNPGQNPVPLDDWLFLLPLAGVGIGVYYLIRKKKEFNV
ncbi:MAG: hypothetical protein GX159_07310 [Flavobacteriaceae bacterium]|jgi:hypothetical protein|nr:hypothetical protein [Flavobacteriaceae bacterium]